MATATGTQSFFGPLSEADREAGYEAYIAFLEAHDGEMDYAAHRLSKREAQMARLDGSAVRWPGQIDRALFARQFERFDVHLETPPETVLLLELCKANAGEAYGVEVLRKARERYHDDPRPQYRAERIVATEEEYHTRLLVGSTRYFGMTLDHRYRTPAGLKVLISSLTRLPRTPFHAVLFAAEVMGIYVFQTLLEATGDVLAGAPEVRDAIEERLTAVLTDEVGHVAYNRLAVGERGLVAGRRLVPLVYRGAASTPEFARLAERVGRGKVRDLRAFDLPQVPEQVRREAFFV